VKEGGWEGVGRWRRGRKVREGAGIGGTPSHVIRPSLRHRANIRYAGPRSMKMRRSRRVAATEYGICRADGMIYTVTDMSPAHCRLMSFDQMFAMSRDVPRRESAICQAQRSYICWRSLSAVSKRREYASQDARMTVLPRPRKRDAPQNARRACCYRRRDDYFRMSHVLNLHGAIALRLKELHVDRC